MIQIVKSIMGQSSIDYINEINIILSNDNKPLLSKDELDVFNYLKSNYDNYQQFPTEEIFLSKFPQYRLQLRDYEVFSLSDLKYYRKQFITKHQNIYQSKLLQKVSTDVLTTGITAEIAEIIRKEIKVEEVQESKLSFRERYTRNMKERNGLKTFVDQIDEEIGSITKGMVCTLAGFTGSFKTTWAVNMAVKNALEGKNIAYISLEVKKEDLEYSMLGLFSSDSRFRGYSPLEHDAIRKNKLNQDEINFLCDVVEPEFRKVIEPNLHILDESCFKSFSESEIMELLTQLDDEKPLDAVFFDHAGLFAYKSPLYNAGNIGVAINKYVSFIRQMSICFRKKDGETRGLASVILAQTNRSGYKEAKRAFKVLDTTNSKKDNISTVTSGYSLTALSDANELERSSSVVLTVYTEGFLKQADQAYVQLLKTRYGNTIEVPIPVNAEGRYYKFGGDASVDTDTLSADFVDELSFNADNYGSAGTSITLDDETFGL